MTPSPEIPEISPLEDRAIRRFEHDREFHLRCYAKAKQLEATQPDDDLGKRLQDAMRALQETAESLVSDEAIVRAARYLGANILGITYTLASIPEQEGLKAGVRRLLAAVNGDSGE